jgi:hypothetical protein
MIEDNALTGTGALIVGAVVILLAVLTQLAGERWRLVRGILALGSAIGFATLAINGPGSPMEQNYSPGALRILSLVAAVFAFSGGYYAYVQIKTWWRHGDAEVDDE